MMTSTIAVIIEAAFGDTVKNTTDGRGVTDLDVLDEFIESVEDALERIKVRRAAFERLSSE